MPKVSIVIPVYFNEGSLPALFQELARIEQRLKEMTFEMELIFVDDGSGDQSFSELLKIKEKRPETKIVKLARNFGANQASKTGLQFVTGDCFVILAADLQDPPDLVLQMVEMWQKGSKFTICVRNSRKDPASSTIFSWIYYRLVRRMVSRSYPRTGFDVALMDRCMLDHLRHSSKCINIPLMAFWLGLPPKVIEYERRERVHGRSRWTFSKKVRFFLDSLLGFSVVPIRAISIVGVGVAILSMIYGLSVVIHAIVKGGDVPGFSTVAALICFLLGTVILMLGAIGEYIWRIFEDVNKRPESVIETIL